MRLGNVQFAVRTILGARSTSPKKSRIKVDEKLFLFPYLEPYKSLLFHAEKDYAKSSLTV